MMDASGNPLRHAQRWGRQRQRRRGFELTPNQSKTAWDGNGALQLFCRWAALTRRRALELADDGWGGYLDGTTLRAAAPTVGGALE